VCTPLELQVGLVDLFFFREQPAFTTTSQVSFEQKQRCGLFFEGVASQTDVFA
jgi:hypothetical protein